MRISYKNFMRRHCDNNHRVKIKMHKKVLLIHTEDEVYQTSQLSNYSIIVIDRLRIIQLLMVTIVNIN